MINIATVRKLALSFEGTTETPHFEKIAFKVKNKIFITLNKEHHRACVKLSAIDQSVFCSYNPLILYPVPNAWGKHGWTLINLKKVPKEMFLDALTTAYCHVAPLKLAEKPLNKI